MTEHHPIPGADPRTAKAVGHASNKPGGFSWRNKRRTKRALHAVCALILFTVLFYWIGGVGKVSIHRPFEYSGDSLEMLSYFTHQYVANDFDTRLRAPFELAKPENGYYLYNALFQSNSNLIWIAKVIGHGDAAKTLNLAYLLSYLLVFLIAYWVSGRLGLKNPFRFFAASLYALMPYHFMRNEHHFFESCYYFTPLLAWVILELWSSRPLGFRWDADRWRLTWRDRRLWGALFLLAFLSSFNNYHQFFFACLAASAAPFAAVYRKSWRPLVVGLGLAVFACAILVLKSALTEHVLAAPALALGVNNQPIGGYGGAEVFPLKLAQLLLPVQDHRWAFLAGIRHMYDVHNPLNNENQTTTLGFVGSVGFLSCMALALVPIRRLQTSVVGKMGLISLMVLLFASMGGFSSIISTISAVALGPQAMLTEARGWNRMVIFIGFFAYFTAFWLLQRFAQAATSKYFVGWKSTSVVWVVGLLIFAFALWDQVPYKISQQDSGHYRSDVQFFASIENRLPAGSSIFQLPFIIHHVSGWVRPGVYYTEQLRPYIVTHSLKFTYGGDSGSPQSEWLRRASALAPDQAAPYLCRYGFAGVLVQRNMLKDPGPLESSWRSVLGEAPEISRDRDYSFFDLRNFCRAHGISPLDLSVVKARLLKSLEDERHWLPADAFSHIIGHVELVNGDKVALVGAANESGWLAYGPGDSLAPGRYEAIFKLSSISNPGGTGAVTLDVAASQATKTLGRETLNPPTGSGVIEKTLRFTVDANDSGLEYRVHKDPGIGVEFLGVEIRRVPR